MGTRFRTTFKVRDGAVATNFGATAMVVKVNVHVGSACLGGIAKPFGSSVTVKHVIDTVLKSYPGLHLQRVDIYPTDGQLNKDRTRLV